MKKQFEAEVEKSLVVQRELALIQEVVMVFREFVPLELSSEKVLPYYWMYLLSWKDH